MAKDPAFLFYSSDFIIGTSFFSNEQIGKYVKLLCFQHQTGHLTEEDMVAVCGIKDERIFSKFKVDETGRYYNPRLEEEAAKRSTFCNSRRSNASTSKAYAKHMENENEDVVTNTTKQQEEKIQFKEFVFMTQGQYDQLAEKLGKKGLNGYVERLNNYIGSQGKRYKSHYHTILSWTAKDDGIKTSVSKPVDNRDLWERKASKSCTNCRGTGSVYAPGSGQYAKCGCVR